MNENIKKVQKSVLDFWNKYDKKQKTLIVSVTLTVIIALVILALVLTKTTYEELVTCEDAATAAQVTEALSSNGIQYETSSDGLTILVSSDDRVASEYLIAQNGLTATGYSMDDYIENMGFSTTTEDRNRLYQKYLEDKIKATLESFNYVKNAYVQMTVPSDKLSVLDAEEQTFVAVKLTLNGVIPEDAPAAMAKYLATAVGNDTTESITIIDSNGNTLFEGQEQTVGNGNMSTTIRNQIYDRFYDEVVQKVSKALATTQMFNTITVAPNLDISFDTLDEVITEYYNPDEVKFNDYIYESTGGTTSGGIPGTDSNDDDTTYYIGNGEGSTSTLTINKNEYAVSSKITHKTGEQGVLDKEASSISVVVNKNVIYNEDKLIAAGELETVTWDEYKASHADVIALEVPEGLVGMISDTTGIPEDSITILYYQVPLFEDSEGNGEFVTNILPIVLAVIILLFLAFVVWRSLRPVEINEAESELSVEELLVATKDKQVVEDIDLEEKSDVRKAVEKFVDENPESVALLLRNWLNEEWE